MAQVITNVKRQTLGDGVNILTFTVTLSSGDQTWNYSPGGRIGFATARERGVALGSETGTIDFYTTPGYISAAAHTANATVDVFAVVEPQ